MNELSVYTIIKFKIYITAMRLIIFLTIHSVYLITLGLFHQNA